MCVRFREGSLIFSADGVVEFSAKIQFLDFFGEPRSARVFMGESLDDWSGTAPFDRQTGRWGFMAGVDANRTTDDPHRDARLGALALRYREPLVRYFIRKRIPKDSAEDCAQEVFLRLARTNEEMVRNAEPYLFTIASSVVVSFARKAKTHRDAHHHPIEDFSLLSGEAAPDRVLEGKEALLRLAAALGELPPETREMFLLDREAGLTYTQIAARYALSVKAVERHIVRALSHLRLRLPPLADGQYRLLRCWSGKPDYLLGATSPTATDRPLEHENVSFSPILNCAPARSET
jgi:RNA polymerase sigma factor (sigma-70 family)